MWSGGSTGSTSLIWFAITFTVQIVPSGRSLVGSSVTDEPGEPLTDERSHALVGDLVVPRSCSSRRSSELDVGSTFVALSAGVVVVTAGAESVVKENV